MYQIDLSKDGHHLDQVFGSILNKLPDLRMPPSFKLAGENDLFDAAKTISLVPFRKQEYFDRVTTLMMEKLDYDSDAINLRSQSVELKPIQRCKAKEKLIVSKERHRSKVECPSLLLLNSYCIGLEKQKKKFERLRRARSHYSKCRIKKRQKVEKSGFNKLVVQPHKDGYPFEEPIPESMRTEQKVDNLREIITMESIDWKMLTPVRPNNEKEEKYFDRLISLHRKRYEEQKKFNQQLDTSEPSFKHIRHKYCMQYNSRNREIFVPLAYRITESTSMEDRNSQSDTALKEVLWDIPKLTVSGESDLTEPNSNQFKKHYRKRSRLNSYISKQDIIRHEVSGRGGSNVVDEADSEQNELIEDSMDERIEEIVGNLMKTSLEVEEV